MTFGVITQEWSDPPVQSNFPPDVLAAIKGAGYHAPYILENDLEFNLKTDGEERPHQVTSTDLLTNPRWINAAKTLVPILRPKDRPGRWQRRPLTDDDAPAEEELSDLEAAQWGIELMGQFNWNITDMASMAVKMARHDATFEQRVAFWTLMSEYDQLPDFTWDGSVRMLKGLGSDITTYVGLSTLGAGLLARFAAKQAGKSGIKAYFRSVLPAAIATGIEGGSYTAFDDYQRQNVKMEAHQQEDYNVVQGLTAGTIGAGAGFVLGGIAPAAVKGVKDVVQWGMGKFRDSAASMAREGGATSRMFVGPKAGIYLKGLKLAKKMQKQGRDRDDIYLAADGWFQDKKGDWKIEISDLGFKSQFNTEDMNKLFQAGIDIHSDLRAEESTEVLAEMMEVGVHHVGGFEGSVKGRWFVDDPDMLNLEELLEKYPVKSPTDHFTKDLHKAAKRIDKVLKTKKIGGAVSHPELFRIYPWLKEQRFDIDTNFEGARATGTSEALDDAEIMLGDIAPERVESIVGHEIQHLIQRFEKWAPGGGPEQFSFDLSTIAKGQEHLDRATAGRRFLEYQMANPNTPFDALWQEFRKIFKDNTGKFPHKNVKSVPHEMYDDLVALEEDIAAWVGRAEDPFGAYVSLAGEAEARNFQTRLDFTMNQRMKRPPWETLDIPEEDLIFLDEETGRVSKSEGPPRPSQVNMRIQQMALENDVRHGVITPENAKAMGFEPQEIESILANFKLKSGDASYREARRRVPVRFTAKDRNTIDQLSQKRTIPSGEIASEYRKLKELYPERAGWAPFNITDVKRNRNGQLEIAVQQEAWGFHRPKGAKQAPDTPDPALVRKLTNKMHKEVRALFKRAEGGDERAKAIIEQRVWYSKMRNRLRAEFGSMADVFADVIGATSAQTNVRQNWENGIDIMRKFSRGDFDDPLLRLKTWIDNGGLLGSGKAENNGYVDMHMRIREEAKAKGKSDDEAFAEAQAAFPLITKDSGRLYNTNSPQAMLALLDLFRQKAPGGAPKTYNFTGNLLGYSHLATIDVWAARHLRRLAGLDRLIPKAQYGVAGVFDATGTKAGGEFGFGQEVFAETSRKLRADGIDLADDDLQAVVWFMEKELWGQKGYTTRAGEGGSLDFEADLAGVPDRDLVTEARQMAETDPQLRQRENIQAAINDEDAAKVYKQQATRLDELSDFVAAKTPVQKRNWVMDTMGIEDKEAADQQVRVFRQEVAQLKREVKKREALQPRLDTLTEKQVARKAEGEATLEEIKAPVRRFTGDISPVEGGKTAPDPLMSDAQKRLAAVLDPDPSYIAGKATASQGRTIDPTGQARNERTIDFEYVTRQDHNPEDVVRQVVQEAKDANRDYTFFSEAIEPNTVEGANPGLEIYFNRDLNSDDIGKITDIIDALKLDIGFTFATDFRFAERAAQGAEVGDYVGLRMQYLPELGSLDAKTAVKAILKIKKKLRNTLDFVSNSHYIEYDTEVFLRDKGDYDAELTGSVRPGRRASWRR